MRQELAALLMSVQLLKEENPGRKIAEIQGQLATVSLGAQESPMSVCFPKRQAPSISVLVGTFGRQPSMSACD